MKKLALALILSAFACGATAGIFDGQTLRFEYHLPDLGTLYNPCCGENPPQHGNYVVGAGVEITNFASDIGTLDLQSDGFTANFMGGGTFNPGGPIAYNGIVLSDVLGMLPAFTSISIVSNSAVSGTPLVSFDADNLYINWAGMPFQPGSVVFAVTAIPEPSEYALLLAGLGLLAFSARRRRNRS